jgi:oligopeptide/dipeptide ABC transporter ATP-binding protein
MYLGKIVEHAKTDELFSHPLHPYTVELLSSAPKLKPDGSRKAVPKGDVPSPINIPAGCPFHPRCPKKLNLCDNALPELKNMKGRTVACHLY